MSMEGLTIESHLRADEATVACVAFLESAAWGGGASPEDIESRKERIEREFRDLDPDAKSLLVAREHDAIVGVCRVRQTPDDGEAWMVFGLAVHPDHRLRGVGRALVQASIDVARSHGARTILSEAHEDNRDSLAFHRAVGFVNEWRFTASDGDEKVGFSMPV